MLGLNSALFSPQIHVLLGLGVQQPRYVPALCQVSRGGLAQPPIVSCRLQVQLGAVQALDPAEFQHWGLKGCRLRWSLLIQLTAGVKSGPRAASKGIVKEKAGQTHSKS